MTPSPPALPESTTLGRTALCVSDLETVTEFYRTVVGLQVLDRDRAGATLGVDGTPLLELIAEETATERPRSAAGLYHNAFRVPTRGALGDALARIRRHWSLDGSADHGVSEALYCADPEGNGVEIYRDHPRDAWPMADDDTVQMDTRRLDLEALDVAAAGADAAPPGTTLGHVHLEVASLEAAREFYAEILGLRVRQELAASALFLAAGDYHHHVGLNTWHGRSTPAPANGQGLAWFEVVVPNADALDALRTRLADADVSISPLDVTDLDGIEATDPGGIEVTDPNGIEIRFRVAR